jgi:MYXO-CTERM domain-containing protein
MFASSATSYQLYVDGVLKKDAIPGDAPSYTLLPSEALTDGFHTWYVIALDGAGATTQSTSTLSTRVDGTPPAAFTLVAPLADAWVGTDTPTFSWNGSSDSVSGLAQYEVWIDGVSQQTGLNPTTLSSSVPLPRASIFLDNFDSCDGWTMTKIPPSPYNWLCTYDGGVHSNIMGIYALATSGTIGSIATSGIIDLSNVGPAQMALHGSNCGARAFQISISDGSAAGFRAIYGSGGTCAWTNYSYPIDEVTGGSSSAIQITGVATPFNSVSVDSIQILGAVGGDHTWQVVAIDAAGNRTSSDSRKLRYDLPPAPFDIASPADNSWTNTAMPTFNWNSTTDAGSGLAKYQVWIDEVLAIDDIPATATAATTTAAMTEGVHKWQVYAVDRVGAVRHSRQTWTLGVDLTPPTQHGLNDPGTLGTPTPGMCWSLFTDRGGSGLDHYSLTIDGVLNRDNIKPGTTGTDCATPVAALSEGRHTLSITGYDAAGNSTTVASPFVIDFSPPAAFALVSPAGDAYCPACGSNIVVVDTLTPTLVWQASSSSGSGLDHYEIYLDDASTCSLCDIPAAATSATLTSPLYPEQHNWQIVAFDHLGGSTRGYTPNNQDDPRAWFTVKCNGTCLSAPEPRPEPAPEPARDGGIDAPMDVMDGPFATATSTSTATSTLTATSTGTATSTSTASSTATGTVVVAEPRPDGAVIAGTDAPILLTDARADAAPSASVPEGGLALADASLLSASDAMVAVPVGGDRPVAVGGPGNDGGADGKSGSSGCGCVVGGHDARTAWGLPLIALVLLASWRRPQQRMRRPRNR